ncbi:MAG: hypothetical protein NVV62_13660 [Terricaulis sp.]|nr:hypothetical protein [Terricaulis sp.]
MRAMILAIAFGASGAAGAAAQTPPLIDGAALAGPPPSAESPQGAADRLAMRPAAPSEARMAQAVADLAFDPWRAFTPVFGEGFTAERFPATGRAFTAVTVAIAEANQRGQNRVRPSAPLRGRPQRAAMR